MNGHCETYTAEIDVDGPCACDMCDWSGDAADLADIEECALDPGDASPAGRCPECDSLAYPVKPEPVAPARAQAGRERFERWTMTDEGIEPGSVLIGLGDCDDYARVIGPDALRLARIMARAGDMLKALERLTHPAADDTDLDNALAVIRAARGAS